MYIICRKCIIREKCFRLSFACFLEMCVHSDLLSISAASLVLFARFSLTNARSSSFRQGASSLGDLVLVRLGAKTKVATHWERRLSLILGNWERRWSWKLVTSGKVHVFLLDQCEMLGSVEIVRRVDVSKRDNPNAGFHAITIRFGTQSCTRLVLGLIYRTRLDNAR